VSGSCDHVVMQNVKSCIRVYCAEYAVTTDSFGPISSQSTECVRNEQYTDDACLKENEAKKMKFQMDSDMCKDGIKNAHDTCESNRASAISMLHQNNVALKESIALLREEESALVKKMATCNE